MKCWNLLKNKIKDIDENTKTKQKNMVRTQSCVTPRHITKESN